MLVCEEMREADWGEGRGESLCLVEVEVDEDEALRMALW